MAGPRRRAREIALQILVQMDVRPDLAAGQAARLYFDYLAEDAESLGEGASGAAGGDALASYDRDLVAQLTEGVAAHRAELDALLQELSPNWRLSRMALVERNVLRLGLFELKYGAPVPSSVVLDEAIELTKRFGTIEGAAFVNGLLDRAATDYKLRR